jgi:2-oxoglutarate ferredoxin oxidoreductase subunit alpha
MDRLNDKWETARSVVPAPVLEHSQPGADAGIIAFGSSHWAVVETLDQLRQEQGIAADYLRVRAYPFSKELDEFIAAHQRVYVVEQNRDGQMLQLIRMHVAANEIAKLRSVCHYSGLPLDARFVTDAIVVQERGLPVEVPQEDAVSRRQGALEQQVVPQAMQEHK